MDKIKEINVRFPREVEIPNNLQQKLSEVIGEIAEYNSPNMWVFGFGYAHSNPFFEPMEFDESCLSIEVNERDASI